MPLCTVRKVIVIGGSTGGISALCTVLKGLPSDFSAATLAVIHTSQHSRHLSHVLARCGSLRVIDPHKNAEPVLPGCLYISEANRHLIVRSQCAISWMGPRENRHRPSVDTLFRTAARVYRSHVVAVVLSGALDDGSAGALAVKARGGTVIVQDPSEAMFNDMPANVLRQVKTDYCLPLAQIAPLLIKLAGQGSLIKIRKPSAKERNALAKTELHEMEPPGFTCPDCGGAVMKIQSGKNTQFRCHVGHNFSLETFTEAQADALERALWVALRKLNEQHSLQESLSKNSDSTGLLKKRHQENADAAEQDMHLLHEILARL